MNYEVLDLRNKSWLNAMKIPISMLFNDEGIFCDHVFASSASIFRRCLRSNGDDGFKAEDGFDLQQVLGDGDVHIKEAENVERRRRVLPLHSQQNLQEAKE
ncbi:hypothetical protein FF2_014631 [Malus domestica]